MRKLFAVPAAATIAAVVLAVTGCGSSSFDTKDLQSKLSADIAKTNGLKAADVTVTCPDDSPADKGSEFTCDATAGGTKHTIAITVTNDDGDFTYEEAKK